MSIDLILSRFGVLLLTGGTGLWLDMSLPISPSSRSFVDTARSCAIIRWGFGQNLGCTGFYGVSFLMIFDLGFTVAHSPTLVAPLETFGLFGFAWTSLGPPHVHWIAPLIFACMIAIANVSALLFNTSHGRWRCYSIAHETANIY